MVWHDGPDFAEFADRFAQDPVLATEMLAAGIAEGDALAAQTPRELSLTDEQRAGFVRMLTAAMPGAGAGVRVEGGATLFALTGDPGVVGAARRGAGAPASSGACASTPPSGSRPSRRRPTLVAALAEGVRDPEYLVRYHSANTLLRWAGRTEEISDDDELFGLLVDDAGARGLGAGRRAAGCRCDSASVTP